MKFKLFIMTITIFSLSNLLFAWTWPLSNSSSQDTFISAFGPRLLNSYYDFHRGMDLQASLDTDVYTAQTGTVTYSGWYGGETGYLITISDGTHKTAYIHLNECIAVLNQQVTEGQQGSQYRIALSGDTGCSGYPHLHFEYRTDSDNDKKHPLQVMPYYDYYYCGAEMVTTDNQDFSFKLTIDDDELDIDIIDIVFIYDDDGFINEEDFDIDYSEEQYIPTGSNNINLFSGDWTMYVYPEVFNPGTDQEITYRFVTDEPEIQALSIEFMPITAEGWNDLEEVFYYQFIGTPVNEEIIDLSKNQLYSNHPNPFNPSTTISYNLAENISDPKIEIYNIKGQKVKIFQLEVKAGESSIVWNGKDENDKSVSSGVYFYRLVNEGKMVQTRKMLLMK